VIGMLAIGGSALEDHPDEIERRFQLTASELSRLAGRIKLVERWQAAANAASDELNREDNGQSNRRGATIANPEPEASSTPAKRRRRRGNRELTLQ
jgi:hypothetical protein